MNENFDAFDDYAMKFDMNEKMIEYKYNHSYRVVHQAEEIARSLDLTENEKNLASIIALLHDIARFRQWTDYKTFDDNKSFNHGEEAVKILFKENEIKNYMVNENDLEILKKAILYHNACTVDFDNLTPEEELQSKIIRDADKLDILYAFSTNRLLELSEDNSEISDKVREDFFKHKQTDSEEIKTKNDRIIQKFAFIYDLYFDYSRNRVKEEKYIEKMYEGLKNKKIFKEYVDEAKKFLKGVKK